MKEKILEVKNLTKYFPIKKGLFGKQVDWLKAVDDISFTVYKGETFGLVGESGCGKSTTSNLLLQLIEADSGSVHFKGKNIFEGNTKSTRELRKKIQVVFQDPYASLDPKWRVGNIIEEPLILHKIGTPKERQNRALQLMEYVGLRQDYYYRYPHEFSGGQRQRIGIARALALNPEIIVADEPVSALDVSIQAQIINMFKRLQEEFNLTYVFIAHDLSVVKHISDRVAVMYLGKIVELATTQQLFNNPKHPYTIGLLSSIPVADPSKKQEMKSMEGEVPSPINPPEGCRFHPRCPHAIDKCSEESPTLKEIEKGHTVSCHLY
ncbi:Oligopeptide ABC transporter, ATP-binding protein OppF [Candidatus Syntrophocurvum alkaliphilum]|uniref:Oligopeptide ABC transporter, ATP-binding protein OppF n=2 Tax=Candidatus Syntrophocurvum alkaliphilum TaxID=2293317 RepID=A0A6I6DJW5_9FIRM|nr:Oligopeptide ABC transporter, ATP-binding protein OppF [Candidatus Syntrophocurvum alkaliphilum]